jgi:DNA modification methylase
MITTLKKNPQLRLDVVATTKPIDFYRKELYSKFKDKLVINEELSRSLVSFQANKKQPLYRWFKYKEAFSHEFINYVLKKFDRITAEKTVLDPFAGAGTTLTTAASNGWKAVGVELLPVGIAALTARINSDRVSQKAYQNEFNRLLQSDLNDKNVSKDCFFDHIQITKKAFSRTNEVQLANFKAFNKTIKNESVREIFKFAALSVLEEISYTRKDGQYLRWDYRSGRNLKSTFNKGKILGFRDAIVAKLELIKEDLPKEEKHTSIKDNIQLIHGSCLEEMVLFPNDSVDLVLTSPPYCNRYDYTRTYALELAYLGLDEDAVKNLRQTLLSATVENKSKRQHLKSVYAKEGRSSFFEIAAKGFENQNALIEFIQHLNANIDQLNNKNIPQMVSNYFFEMNLLVAEMARVLKPGGRVIMVNDNVQYQGEELPVDLILSNMAECYSLEVESIWVLERGKGNSSQQMGVHGRNELRKCVYVWQKPLHGPGLHKRTKKD